MPMALAVLIALVCLAVGAACFGAIVLCEAVPQRSTRWLEGICVVSLIGFVVFAVHVALLASK